MAMSPPRPSTRARSARARSAASCGSTSRAIQSAAAFASRTGMIRSPWPVVDTAPLPLSAYRPAPTNGESPTRPLGLNGAPPVEVAAARSPRASRATAPTVSRAAPAPNIVRAQSGSGCARWSSQRRRSRSDASSAGSHRSTPHRSAKRAAPGPTTTANGLSRTRRASVTGCGTPCTAATEPTARVPPSMIPASSSTMPSSFRLDPRPAPKMPEASMSLTARSTASRALPPVARTSQPAAAAARHPCRWVSRSGSGMSKAPP